MQTNVLFKADIKNDSALPDTTPKFIRYKPEASDQMKNTIVPSKQRNIILFDQTRRSNKKERELEWWIGKVTEIYDEYFTAVLEDLDGRTNLVEFEKNAIDPDERDLVFLGSTFTYSISVIDDPIGGREYKTKMAFSSRRKWLKEYEDKANALAEDIFPERLLNL